MKRWYWIVIVVGVLSWALGDREAGTSRDNSQTPTTSSATRPSTIPTTNSSPQIRRSLFVTGDVVNVRSGPGVSYQRIGQLKRGASVREVETHTGWSRIEFKGRIGWMSAKYLSPENPVRHRHQVSKPVSPKRCHPSYEGKCVPFASDVDCAGGSGNGPAYVRGPVRVVGRDVYRLDRDHDGIGCE